MSTIDFQIGSSTVDDFWKFIVLRHSIWYKRFIRNLPWPWTDDPILLKYKFTNIFRQLDRGTIALHSMLARKFLDMDEVPPCKYELDYDFLLWTVIWYRIFNRFEHALDFVNCSLPTGPQIHDYIKAKIHDSKPVFTSAYRATSYCGGRGLAFSTYCKGIVQIWEMQPYEKPTTMQGMFNYLQTFPLIGPFAAYEIVCDLRFTQVLSKAPDKNTWANIGPGSTRGLQRLGLPVCISSMTDLLKSRTQKWRVYPPFELREIEHSLCEFDKYERTRTGIGRPRSRYDHNKF